MNKFHLNYIVDVFAGISFFLAAVSALVLYFLPRGIAGGGNIEFLGIARKNWSELHTWAGLICIVLIVIHVLLHYKAFIIMTKAIFAKKGN